METAADVAKGGAVLVLVLALVQLRMLEEGPNTTGKGGNERRRSGARAARRHHRSSRNSRNNDDRRPNDAVDADAVDDVHAGC